MALAADVEIPGQTLATYNLHLESRESDALRVSQLGEVLTDAVRRTSDRVMLIAGDLNLNASEGGAGAALKQAGFRDAVGLPSVRTRPARGLLDQGRSIDWIFLAGELKCSEGQVHRDVRASDHLPVSFLLSAR
jgi:endonuclease/exonuclease/phosphatase family metal-dependent hydrolase